MFGSTFNWSHSPGLSYLFMWKSIVTTHFDPENDHRTGYGLLGSNYSLLAQVAQARNISIGEHRHCCVTFEYKDLYGKKTYRFCNLRKWKDFNKKQLTLHKMCVAVTETICFSPVQILVSNVTQQCQCSPMLIYFELGLPVLCCCYLLSQTL